MSRATPTPVVTARPAVATPRRLVGEVVYLYAFDVAYELRDVDQPTLLGQPLERFDLDPSKRQPKQLFFFRPQMFRLPPLERQTRDGLVRLRPTVKLLPVGAISVTLRVDFDVTDLGDLTHYHDLRFNDGRGMHDEARALAERVRQAVMPWLVRPRPGLSDEEAYTVFCLQTPSDADGQRVDVEPWLERNRRAVAAVLTEEHDPAELSAQECNESTGVALSYSRRDLAVVDWDAALIVDDPRQFDATLYVLELANLQLTELEAYDALLDETADRTYADLRRGGLYRWGGRGVQRQLREIRVDLARLADELGNISKFFGDYHAGRLYQHLAQRFHFADWQRTIDHKLRTLDELYQLMATDRTNRWMLFLEAMIVLLFLFEIGKAMLETGK